MKIKRICEVCGSVFEKINIVETYNLCDSCNRIIGAYIYYKRQNSILFLAKANKMIMELKRREEKRMENIFK